MIFDEIDTGISGEISNSMANLMLKMSKKMQIISITHLPQVAAKDKINTMFISIIIKIEQ